MIEKYFTCPSCLQNISILIDPSINAQEYIEDCEVCCRPLSFSISLEGSEIISFNVQLAQ